MSNTEFAAAGGSRHDGVGDCANHCGIVPVAGEQDQRMKTIADQAVRQRSARCEISPPCGTKARDRSPCRVARLVLSIIRPNLQANKLISATGVENILIPCEDANASPGSGFANLDRGGSGRRDWSFIHLGCDQYSRLDLQSSLLRARNSPMASTSIFVRWKQSV